VALSLLVACRVNALLYRPGSARRQAYPNPQRSLSSPLRILHLTAPARAGGLESVVRLLAKGQQSTGNQVLVAAVIGEKDLDHPFLSALRADGLASQAIRLGAKSYLSEWRRIRALFAEWKPDIAHTHGYRSDVIGGMAAASARLPRVTTVHGFTGGNFKNRVNEWAQVRSYRSFSAVVAVSRAIASRLQSSGVRGELVHTIPNAIDENSRVASRLEARKSLGLADDDFVVGWVGRVSREKGADVLIEALPSVDKPFKVIFIGDGPERALLEKRAELLGVGSVVRWVGVRPDAASIFSAFDTFVLSSRTEGIPIVLLEAMRASVPIVSTRVGGVPEMLDQSEALLVDAERPDLLAVAINSVRSDPSAARSRANAARARLERDFTVEPWVGRYDALYRSIVALNGGRAR
jgi:glycosyltransferase involved in cell wall biosynthesis